MRSNQTQKLVKVALMTALTLVFTATITIPTPVTQGYIHLGDSMVFLSAILLGPVYGAIAAAVGSALADAYLGYPIWIIPTFIIKGVMAYLLGYFMMKGKEKKIPVTTIVLGLVLCTLFFACTGFLMQNAITNQPDVLLAEVDQNTMDTIIPKIAGIGVGVIVLVAGLYTFLKRKVSVSLSLLIGMVLSGIWMVFGYYIASWVLYGSPTLPIFSIPSNIVQFVVGLIIAFTVSEGLERAQVLGRIQDLT